MTKANRFRLKWPQLGTVRHTLLWVIFLISSVPLMAALFLVALVFGIASVILGSLVGLVGGTGAGIGRILSGLVEAGFGAVASFVSIAVSAAAYRQLAVRRSELFE